MGVYEDKENDEFLRYFNTRKSSILEKIHNKYIILKDDYLKELYNECLNCNTIVDLKWYGQTIDRIERLLL